jgi:mRNA interferase RelE/StbE
VNGAATLVASRQFDEDLSRLPEQTRERVQREIDRMGTRLATFAHYRMRDSDKFRLRVGDYRVIYRLNVAVGEIYLVAIGHRREIYRF